jgi:hypothetical protein
MEIISRKLRVAAQGIGAAALLATSSIALAQSSATIPVGMQGTYELEFQPASGAPALLPGGTKLDLVLASGGTTCIADYVLVSPTVTSGNSVEAFYIVPSLGIKLALSNISSGQFNEVNVFSMSDQFLGQFSPTGPKKSNSTTCPLIGSAQADLGDIARIIKLAEEQFTDLFPTSGANNAFQVIDGFIARTYTASGISVGIKNGTVYVAGGAFGSQPVTIGTIANTLAQLTGGDPVDEPVVEVPEGDYDLKVAGNVTVVAFGQTVVQPFEMLMEKVQAPGSTEVNNLEDDVRKVIADALAEAEDGNPDIEFTFSAFDVSEISVSSSRVFYRAKFQVTTLIKNVPVLGSTSSTAAYNLTFEFTKR